MKEFIVEMVNNARKDFGIKEFPGNFFEHIVKERDYIDKYKLALFKQSLGDDNSGFICYTSKERAFICINNLRTIGHQNFTLAHEIAHIYLHKGINFDDTDDSIKIKEKEGVEYQANQFAAELLYPIEYVQSDIDYIENNNLLENGNEIEIGDYTNEIAQKYCISFRFALLRILFNSDFAKRNCVLKKVDLITEIVSPLSVRYDEEFYIISPESEYYKPYIGILEEQKRISNILVEKDGLGVDSATAINGRLEELEGFHETFI
ncbi:ImmA/IrrE family metallo-endopeptidase [Clostridium gasigenes]|uniref:ImmA/IrrE family metallo-endopeptidase n=1 Tax=Clostridium gasigenes TaxID=94869 RepID=UPI001C0B0E49|nr:ImmA/IrrE family metallo-endopeptidase [Clostridium gasigenes]MBU3089825.1 ImmA/IrrE family metallo-endopeptidase [Clostridium gasigenes]